MTKASTPVEYFRKEAKRLLKQVNAKDEEALMRVMRVLKDPAEISLMRVQHVIAVEYGFSKWENLLLATAEELQLAISKKKEMHIQPQKESSISEGPIEHTVKLRVPPPGETPLVSMLRGPFESPMPPRYAAFADLMDTKTMREQERWLDEDARRMGLFKK